MFDLDHFIADCRTALTEQTPEVAIREIVERAVAQPGKLEAAFGVPRQGEAGVLHHTPELTILKVIWAPGMAIYPHDHRLWAVIGLYGGREDNTFYRRTGTGLEVAGGKHLEVRDTVLLGKSVIHSVANPLRAFTSAIHIYGGDFFATPRSDWDPDTMEERPYDVERLKRVIAEANERWRAHCAPTSPDVGT
jgi:predicted metal-dependent enzyme (double-stranded beta helix superfamily)